jgi:hypothetical protein
MVNIALIITSVAILIMAIAYSYTMLVEVRDIKKELENLRKKYNL